MDIRKVFEENLRIPVLRYLLMLYFITFFAQILKFNKLGILPSKGNYDFLLILNYTKEISQLIIVIFGSLIICYILNECFEGIHKYIIDILRVGILVFYLKSYQEFEIYIENYYIIFLCWIIMFIIETFYYEEFGNEIECKYTERVFYNKIIIYGIIIAKGIVYVQNTIKI